MSTINPMVIAMRRPLSVMVAIIAVVLASALGIRPKWVDDHLKRLGVELPVRRMAIDIFPALDLPVIYVCQPYGGMDPAQMEGLLTNYYEYHFLYITGIHHVESRNVQGAALMKLVFHAGTNMAQAMAETINYVNRSRAFMPPGTVSPFVMRFDTGSVPVGYLVLSSATRTISEIQDQALFKVRPMFAALPGVSAPPPFGGSARSVVVRCDPQKLLAYQMSPEEVVAALGQGNTVSPSGNLRVGDRFPIVPTNAMVKDIRELGEIPIREGVVPTVYLRDVAVIEDAADVSTGYALVNGRRAVYILATKRADASTMSVIDEIKSALPKMQRELPDDIRVTFEFDQSVYVTRALASLRTEGVLGALLTGLMVLLFLRDWRSAVVVVVNIPLAILAALLGLWLCGQTINLMTLGGLALAVGILVDEATVEIENIHTQLPLAPSIASAVRAGNRQTAVPRFLAMLCMLAVFVPAFFMQGAAGALFAPLAMAVGFSMMASYVLSSTFVPVLATWLLRRAARAEAPRPAGWLAGIRGLHGRLVGVAIRRRLLVTGAYLVGCLAIMGSAGARLGLEIFPRSDAGEFRLRLRAPDGTHIERTEQLTLDVLDVIKECVGADSLELTLGYVGTVPSSYPINGVYQWSRGPEESMLRVKLKRAGAIDSEALKERLRKELASRMPDLRVSFEPADIVSEVMSFGSPAAVEIAARSASLDENRKFIERVLRELERLPGLRDLQVSQSLDYPTIDVKVSRDVAGRSGVTMAQVARSVVAATSSSRFVVPNYWPDPKTGIGYQVQVEIPQPALRSTDDLARVPLLRQGPKPVLLRDVAQIAMGTMPGQFDRYNMKREITLTGNIAGTDLGTVSRQVARVLARVQQADDAEKDRLEEAGGKPVRVTHELRGQIPPMRSMVSGLGAGLLLAVLVIFLMLVANFQSVGLALVTVAPVPCAIMGAVLALFATGATLSIQSFIGTIMSMGVAMANSILLVTFAESSRRAHGDAVLAAVEAATGRLRPVLMTSCAMIAGMAPIALGLGEGGRQTAPLGQAVVGGLAAATAATLFVLPAVFVVMRQRASRQSASLDPDDPHSSCYQPSQAEGAPSAT